MSLRRIVGGSAVAAAAAVAIAALPGCTVTFQPATVVWGTPGQPPPPPQSAAPAADPQLEQLVAPIALYPDPILAQLLPASTYPDQVAAAARWLQDNPNPSQADIDAQDWAPPVKALVHYPEALQQLNNDPQWTQSLGSAVSQDQASVMAAIQDMRQQAKTVGSLTDSPQTTVVANGDDISIEPTNPDVVYVPTYDPVIVYTTLTPIVWGVGFSTGPWLVNGIFWGGGTIFVGDWRGPWRWDHGHWGYNAYWRPDHFHDWHHDAHFGPAPHLARANWATPRGALGREGAFRAAIAHHNAVREQTRRAQTNTRNTRATPSRGGSPGRGSGRSEGERGRTVP